MQVLTLIESLTDGELGQLALSEIGTKDGRNEIQEKNLTRLVNFVNQGVLELYKEFPIKVDADTVYVLEPSTTDNTVDLPESALYLMKITREDGTEVPIDDYDIEYRFKQDVYKDVFVKTVAINKYLVLGKFPSDGVALHFHYTSAPEALRSSSNVPLPMAYEEALRLFVSHKAYSTTRSVTPVGDEGFTYKKKYDEAVEKLKQKFDVTYDWADPERLRQKGFV
jgi:hypothetical protein